MRRLIDSTVDGPYHSHEVEFEVEVDDDDFSLLEVYVCRDKYRRAVLDILACPTQWRLVELAHQAYQDWWDGEWVESHQDD